MHLARFPRLHFGHFPTPLEPLTQLSRLLEGPNIWIKRDDCTGLATGGNKTRKLEFLLGDAQAKQADIIITQGATQSSAGTQAGLIAGLTATHSGIPLLGISVRAPREKQEHNVWRLAQQTRELLGVLEKESVYASLFDKINLTPASRLGDINDFLDDAALSDAPAGERLTAAMQVFMDCIRQSGKTVEKLDKTLIDHHIAELDYQISRQLTELVTPLTAPQAYLYPWLLSLNRLSVVEWVWLEKRFLLAAKNGGHPPGCLLLTSHQSESVVKSHLINMLFIRDEQRKRHMLRWFDPRVLFHLCWMMDARSLADMLHIRDIPDWTYWLNGRWHTLSFARNDEPDPAPPEAYRLFNQLQHVGLINDVLATLPDEADLSQREHPTFRDNGRQVAFHGYKCTCGCTLISSLGNATTSK